LKINNILGLVMSSVFYEKVEEALKKIRPFLQADGGDVELVRVTEDGIVEVKLTGACIGCPMSQMTLRAGVERALLKEIPGIRRVEQVD
jgi:Fe-S cluster biogenesis protein NfuA